MITLREMCQILGVSRRTIQGYESAALLAAQGKNKYGHLLYSEESLERAKQIHFLQQLGFYLSAIRGIIDAPSEVKRQAVEDRLQELRVEQKERAEVIWRAEEYLAGLR